MKRRKTSELTHTDVVSGPKPLIRREAEIDKLTAFLRGCIERRQGGSLYVCGSTGTGKTAGMVQVLADLENWVSSRKRSGPRVRVAHFNANTFSNPRAIYGALLRRLLGSQRDDDDALEQSADDSLDELEALLCPGTKSRGGRRRSSSTNKTLHVVVVDEIDQLLTSDSKVLYKLFEWPARPRSSLILVGIANAIDLGDRFLPQLRLNNCEPQLLLFQAYDTEKLGEIVRYRIAERAKALNVTFDPPAIQLCVRKVAAMSGDARKALDICHRALDAATLAAAPAAAASSSSEDDSSPPVAPPKRVGVAQIKRVMNAVYVSPHVATMQALPQQAQFVLCAAVRLRREKRAITISTLCKAYKDMAGQWQLPTVGFSEFNAAINRLESYGILSVGKKNHRQDAKQRKVTLDVQDDDVTFAFEGKVALSQLLSTAHGARFRLGDTRAVSLYAASGGGSRG